MCVDIVMSQVERPH